MSKIIFSIKRRHTRWPRDWSSDVCSSDLNILLTPLIEQIYGMYDEEKLIKAPPDRAEDNEKAVVLIENEFKEVIINQSKNKPLKSGDVINLTQVDRKSTRLNSSHVATSYAV